MYFLFLFVSRRLHAAERRRTDLPKSANGPLSLGDDHNLNFLATKLEMPDHISEVRELFQKNHGWVVSRCPNYFGYDSGCLSNDFPSWEIPVSPTQRIDLWNVVLISEELAKKRTFCVPKVVTGEY
jgi:hypothetical protein